MVLAQVQKCFDGEEAIVTSQFGGASSLGQRAV